MLNFRKMDEITICISYMYNTGTIKFWNTPCLSVIIKHTNRVWEAHIFALWELPFKNEKCNNNAKKLFA